MGMRKIRKLGSAVGGALATLVLTTLPAAAQQYPPPQPTETVVPKGEVAFTGTDITLLIVAVGVLLVAGLAALIVARRRAAIVSH
jgi:LPXTG-motif cell wall-anchored protein